MKKNSYSYSFLSSESPEDIFKTLTNVKEWWYGIYNETIKGKTRELGDEFSFEAGGDAHCTKQKLVELNPAKKIVWLVVDSNLSFLDKPNEWDGTKIGFDLLKEGKSTRVTFTHEGLVPDLQGYKGCSDAWSQYMHNLKEKLSD